MPFMSVEANAYEVRCLLVCSSCRVRIRQNKEPDRERLEEEHLIHFTLVV